MANICSPFGRTVSSNRPEEHTSELQSHSDLHSFPTRRSSDLFQLPLHPKFTSLLTNVGRICHGEHMFAFRPDGQLKSRRSRTPPTAAASSPPPAAPLRSAAPLWRPRAGSSRA